MDYKGQIAKALQIDGMGAEEIRELLADTALPGGGDISLPCFKLAGRLKKPPQVLAAEIAGQARDAGIKCAERVEAAGGYVNFFLKRTAVARDVLKAVLRPSKGIYGDDSIGKGKTVCIDYSSVNIAKEFHIGHLSTTVIGAALYRIYKKLGYRVVGINHLGDWGTQFGKLIVAYKLWGHDKSEALSVAGLQKIYVRFHEEAEKNPALEDEARTWFKKIEAGDKEALRLFGLFKEITLREVDAMYKRLGVTFDSFLGESFFSDKMKPVLDECVKKGVAAVDDGALAVDLTAYNMPPCLLLKADGASLYATRDIAAAEYRYQTYKFYKCLYVVAYQQNLHFKQFFKVLELLGRPWAGDLAHVAYGMVSLEEGAMSTRKGNVVLLRDCLDTAAKKALAVIDQKSPGLDGKERAAEAVGVSAVVFSALYNSRIKDIVFNYDKILNFEGETGPYLLYTAARCNSVLAAYAGRDNGGKPSAPQASIKTDGIVNDEGYEVLKLLSKYPETLRAAAEQYEPSHITRLLMHIAQAYNKFYFEHRILGAKEEQSRLALTAAVLSVLKDGFALLGLKFLEKM